MESLEKKKTASILGRKSTHNIRNTGSSALTRDTCVLFPKNKVDMEERIPTMSYMYNRILRIKRSTTQGQAKILYVEHIPTHSPGCPQFGSFLLKFYDHYQRKAIAYQGRDERILIINSKRYRCDQFHHLFRTPIEGLMGKRRSVESFRKFICQQSNDGMNNKSISTRHGIG